MILNYLQKNRQNVTHVPYGIALLRRFGK